MPKMLLHLSKSALQFLISTLTLALTLTSFYSCSPKHNPQNINLAVAFSGDAQIEVGGPYVGASFHHSCMIPQRISFFNPIANSIDESTDYWFRDTTFAMEVGLKIGVGEWIEFKRQSAKFDLTPYNVKFYQDNIQIAYQFCKDKPVMVITYTLKNPGDQTEVFELKTRLSNTIRTCHTYRRIQAERTEYDSTNFNAVAHYSDAEIENIVLFIANATAKPVETDLDEGAISYLYSEELVPNEQIQIVQLVGSSFTHEVRDFIAYAIKNYRSEVTEYENFITDKAIGEYSFNTGDPVFDRSVYWAKAMLASLDHYIDGVLIPMPCPAEYNFYFTHDVLVTDLAAVNFDLPRVKRDLEFILKHATDDFIIPHAYYWKDGAFRTEYADSNNWNHFWFIQVAASYLRHSDDEQMLRRCYPYLQKSLDYALHSKEADGLLYAYYLDGWDIGHNFGPRAFMTIMAIKGIRDFVYISAVLQKNIEKLPEYELMAEEMETALEQKLWSGESGFLMNYYENGELDPHYYSGSLLAAHYGLLDNAKRQRLIATAAENLVDPHIGTYTVYPADFHRLGDFLKFKGNEVGPPYHYANGGVWNHCNAWYSLGLMATGQPEKAAQFIRRNMTLDGIIDSPNGQPAMYEYRCSDANNPAMYGKIDKPNFLWAAGWYLYALYHLYGVQENVWNISIQPFLPEGQSACEFDLNIEGKKKNILIQKDVSMTRTASAIFKKSDREAEYQFTCKTPGQPYLESAEAIVLSCDYNSRKGELSAVLKAFPGHRNRVCILASAKPGGINFENRTIENYEVTRVGDSYRIGINVIHTQTDSELIIKYNPR
ncbi:MAG: hypothetical protein M0R34_02905 [Candidatus Marinimicrobia bacterium]|nr:hypothetical protein [Candidatus Neomarinimicrobiota bacterium]